MLLHSGVLTIEATGAQHPPPTASGEHRPTGRKVTAQPLPATSDRVAAAVQFTARAIVSPVT